MDFDFIIIYVINFCVEVIISQYNSNPLFALVYVWHDDRGSSVLFCTILPMPIAYKSRLRTFSR